MAYTKTTNFLAKDSLPLNNAAKYVKGSEIDTEFDNIAAADALNVKTTALGAGIETFLGTPSSSNLAAAVTGETGTGALVFATSPSLVTPVLGTPSSGTLTSCTGLPVATGISGLGTGVATALAVNVGSAGAPVVNGGALGTPSGGTLTNCTGLPGSLVAGTPLSKDPVAANSTTTTAHGLAARPRIFDIAMECLSADLNYSGGDIVILGDGYGGGANTGINVLADATNTILLISSQIVIQNKTSYVGGAIDVTKWKITITPYKII